MNAPEVPVYAERKCLLCGNDYPEDIGFVEGILAICEWCEFRGRLLSGFGMKWPSFNRMIASQREQRIRMLHLSVVIALLEDEARAAAQ